MNSAALIYYTNSNVQANRNERDIITIKIVGAKILIFKIFFFLGGFVDIKLIRDTKDPISHLPISEFVLNKKFRRNASKMAFLFSYSATFSKSVFIQTIEVELLVKHEFRNLESNLYTYQEQIHISLISCFKLRHIFKQDADNIPHFNEYF